MILESIELTHVGMFGEIARIGPLTLGLNVLPAYNEEGKSTLVRAAARGLFDAHTSASEEIRQLQPIGTSLGPCITVVFKCGAQKFCIEKVFLNGPRSRLSTTHNDHWKLIAEGDAADNKLRELLQSEKPGRGATKPAHWGLFQYLWARQGEPASWPTWDGETGKVVRARLAHIELDPMIERLNSALQAESEPIFTAQGRPKLHGPLEKAETELARLKVELHSVRDKQRELEVSQTRFQELTCRLLTLERERQQSHEEADAIRQQAGEVERLEVEVSAKNAEFESARKQLHTVEKDSKDISAAEALIKELESDIERARHESEALRTNETSLASQQLQVEQVQEQLRQGREEKQSKLDRTLDLLKFRRRLAEFNPIQDRFKEAKRRNAEVAQMQEQTSALPVVTAQNLQRLRELEASVNQLKAQIEIIGVSAELTPIQTGEVEVEESGTTRNVGLRSGVTETIKSGEPLLLRLHEWGTIRVKSGATELRDLRDRITEEERKIDSELAELGLNSIAEVVRVFELHREFDEKLREATKELNRALVDFDDLDSLRRAITQHQRELQALEEKLHPTELDRTTALADFEAHEQGLRAELRSVDKNLNQHADQLHSLNRQLTDCRQNRAKLDNDQAVFGERLKNARRQIDAICKSYSTGLEAAKVQAQREFSEAEARLAAGRAKLPPDADKLPERNRRAAKAAADAEEAVKTARTQRDELAGTLRTLGAEATYSRETELFEKIAIFGAEADAARRRGWAARLLCNLLERRKQAATRAVLAPLQEMISATFADLTRNYTRRVYLDENLQIRGIGRNENELLQFETLSQGAREQLLLALRIAVANALADSEPQTLILDDVLVNTDPVRQQRVLDLLQSAAQHLQILVLTCHPDSYRGVGNQVRIELKQSDRTP